jgi:hypothetical protein
MNTTTLTSDEIRALARMARGGVFVDREGRGLLAGREVVAPETVSALEAAELIALDALARKPRLTGAGRAALAAADPR